jgi:hypothetical protein
MMALGFGAMGCVAVRGLRPREAEPAGGLVIRTPAKVVSVIEGQSARRGFPLGGKNSVLISEKRGR